jgi:hypothetical protein
VRLLLDCIENWVILSLGSALYCSITCVYSVPDCSCLKSKAENTITLPITCNHSCDAEQCVSLTPCTTLLTWCMCITLCNTVLTYTCILFERALCMDTLVLEQHTIGGTASKPHIKVSTHSSSTSSAATSSTSTSTLTLPTPPPGKKRGGKQGGKKDRGTVSNGNVQQGEVDSDDETSTGGSGDAAAVMQGITVSAALDGRALQKLVKLAALLPR